MNIARITDVTLMTTPQISQVTAQKSALRICSFILAIGVATRIANIIPAQKAHRKNSYIYVPE